MSAVTVAIGVGVLQVKAQLEGRVPFPWEQPDSADTSGESDGDHNVALGVFRTPLLALLNRDPAERGTADEFCIACNEVVARVTTTATGHHAVTPRRSDCDDE